MIYLIISILLNTLLFIIFKLFRQYSIHNVQAIVTNYFVATSLGLVISSSSREVSSIASATWNFGALVLGVIFISTFITLAKTTQNNGLAIASIASKMSVIIPVVFAFIVYKDSLHFLKIIGILFALIAVYFSAYSKNSNSYSSKHWLLPILLFIGAGILDTTLKYIEITYVPQPEIALFTASIFGSAFLFGLLYIVLIQRSKWHLKNILAGIVLGIPNYFSIYFLIKALKHQGLESSVIFPINHIGVVLATSICGVLLFNEKLNRKNWLGLALAILAIFCISLKDWK